MVTKPVVLYKVKDRIAYITLNRPEKLNAVNPDVFRELAITWKRFEEDHEAWVAIFSGAGRAFCAGADLNAAYPEDVREIRHQALWSNGITVFKPIVGAVHGYAIGVGYFLAIRACDITIAAEGTQFGLPEARFGAAEPMDYVPYMPFKITLEFMLTGQMMNAQSALELGLINKVVPQTELMSEAIKYAEVLKKNAPLALRAIKYGQYRGIEDLDRNLSRRLSKYMEWEEEHFCRPVAESEDAKEGARAFLEKREPKYKGR